MGEGSGSDARILVIITSFIAFSALLLGSASGLFNSAQQYNDVDTSVRFHFDSTELADLSFWYDDDTPRNDNGYNASDCDVGSYCDPGPFLARTMTDPANSNAETMVMWDDASDSDRAVCFYHIHDGHGFGLQSQSGYYDYWTLEGRDGWVFVEKWGWWDWKAICISDDEIVGAFDSKMQRSHHTLQLQRAVEVYFLFNESATKQTVQDYVDADDYTIIIGTSIMGTAASGDAWALMAGLLTFDSEITNIQLVNWIVGVILWSAIIYLVISIVARLIPFA